MPINQDIFLRAHTTTRRKSTRWGDRGIVSKWPERVLVFDTETTIDTKQDLTFGAYRLCRLVDDTYACADEGFFHNDELDPRGRAILVDYIQKHFAEVEIKSFPPNVDLKVYSRADFMERVFWKHIRNAGMVVGFNLPFDLSRLALRWSASRKGGWSLILSQRRSRETQQVEANPDRPRIRIQSTGSKSAFTSTTRPRIPEEWPEGRFLDLRTLAFALFDKSYSLDSLCTDVFKIDGKLEHEPTGKISVNEIEYCRRDVDCTLTVLNLLKQEFDQHPIKLRPDRVYSPASIAKAYLDVMGVAEPKIKFDVSDSILGIAMQAYYGGRAECRIRRTPVPIVHTDFSSQYPTVNTLLGNFNVLTAANVSFEESTEEVRMLLSSIELEDIFNPDRWRDLAFFALVRPDNDIFPVRTVYNGETQNIGVNQLCSSQPLWFAGPDVVASALLAGKPPQIVKAIRMVPHGRQNGLQPTSLRGMVTVDPQQHDFFRHVVEQRNLNKSNKPTSKFLKVLGNSGSYGLFVEITPEKLTKPTTISVFSGEASFQQSSQVIEPEGPWYFPPVAALITAGGRLLLAMLERCVTDAGGTYLFCDTDSLCIVASEHGGSVKCATSGGSTIRALTWKHVRKIADRFNRLNPYDRTAVPELLKIEDVNYDASDTQRQLYGFGISAKRYALFEKDGDKITIVDPKAHGLGYLYPPKKTKKGKKDWTFEAWDWLLRKELGLPLKPPPWFDLPAMMRIVMNTPQLGNRLKNCHPFNFLLCPMIDSVAGYPAGIDPGSFTLVTPFETKSESWMDADYTNTHDGKSYQLALLQTPKLDRVIPQTFGYVLRRYAEHPESKSLAPDGAPCSATTRGLLQRASVVVDRQQFVGKETDRRWDQGEDISLTEFKPTIYGFSQPAAADSTFRELMAKHGVRELMRRTGMSQHTLEKIRQGRKVRPKTLKRVHALLLNE